MSTNISNAGRNNPVIVAYGRSPVCKANKGSLRNENPVEFGAQTLKGVLDRVPQLPWSEIDRIVAGCAFPENLQNYNVAKQIGFRAGLPNTCTGMTVSAICSSGLLAISTAVNSILAGEIQVAVAGGVESMSTTIMYPRPEEIYDKLYEQNPGCYITPGGMAESLSRKLGITREDMDQFSLRSHRLAHQAQVNGWFDDQIIPIVAHDDDGNEIVVTKDEGIRPESTMETLAGLKPAFREDGQVTAGNSSIRSDGASFVVVMSQEKAEKLGMRPIAEFCGFQLSAMDPAEFGLAPTLAAPALLDRLGLAMEDMDVVELHEAFAAQSVPCSRLLRIPEEKLNPTGGAIAFGHPLGATGGVLVCKALSFLKRTGGTYGLITMCVGGGMGAAGIIKMAQ